MLSELKTTGQAIRPAMAMFNHSCDPNMVRADLGRYAYMYCLYDKVRLLSGNQLYDPFAALGH